MVAFLLSSLLVVWTSFTIVVPTAAAFCVADHLHHRSSLQHFKQQQLQQQAQQHLYLHHHAVASSTLPLSSSLCCPTAKAHHAAGGGGCPTSTMVLRGHRNTARTDVQNLLTQRALQSFIDLLHNCRDGATVRWLETTYEFRNLEMYHGTAGLDLQKYDSWDAILFDMIQRPNDTVVVSAKRRGRGHGGWSKNNPFLEEVRIIFDVFLCCGIALWLPACFDPLTHL
jgi:hypothetical protein